MYVYELTLHWLLYYKYTNTYIRTLVSVMHEAENKDICRAEFTFVKGLY